MNNKNTFFFKKFKVKHDKCAMKVGTDGVLLGAWANLERISQVLDVGTGTGLIALMLAQRRSSVTVLGIELDKQAVIQARENANTSLFEMQIQVEHKDFNTDDFTQKFDLVISNPPFFMNSLKTPKAERTQARHTDSLGPEVLIEKSYAVLSEEGQLAMIFPSESDSLIQEIAVRTGFFVGLKCHVFATVQSELPKRTLWQFTKMKCEPIESELVIEKSRHVYTDEYIALTREFYLKM